MTSINTLEKRIHRRFPLSPSDGVYCIVIRSKEAHKSIALAAKDFSESGFRLAIIPPLKEDFIEGEKLFLSAITGSRNIIFKAPVELRVRWQSEDYSENLVYIGCEIFNITASAKRQFIAFIQAEAKFNGLNGQNRPSEGSPQRVDAVQEPTALQERQQQGILKAVLIHGSPRHDGNTAKITGWVEEALVALGHDVERIDLFSKKVNDCLGCLKCKNNSTQAGCVLKDDVAAIIHKMIPKDIVIYASSLYHGGFGAQMKALVDRCHSLHRGLYGTPEHTSLIEGQRQALIATTNGPFVDNAEHILTTFHRMLSSNKALSAGELIVCNCSTPDALGDDIKDQTGRFAHQLCGSVHTPYSILIPGRA